jgi:hypothetical protein
MIVWLAIGGYAVLSGAIAALFRAGIGAAQADASRYVTFSLYLMVALINLVPMIGADWQRHRAETSQGASIWRDLQVGLATVSILLYVLTLPGSFHDFGAQGRVLRQTKAALLMINLFPANPQLKKRLTFDPPATLVVATRLSEKGLLHPPLIASRDVSTFQDTSPAAPTGSFGQIENYGQSGNRILVVGQALQPGASRSADLVFLTYEDDAGRQFVLALAELGKIPAEQEPIPNEDPELALSHWAAEIPLERLPRQLKPPALRAWELDVQTGKAIQLGGAVQTQIAPAN